MGSDTLPAVRRFFQMHVGFCLGVDIDTFANGDGRAEPFDLAISEFIKQGGSRRLLWYIVREKQLLTEVQKEAKLDNDDALSNAQSSMSTASAGGASVMSKLNDDDSKESHSTTSSAAAQQRIIVSTDQLHTLEQYNCIYFLRDTADPSPITEDNICTRVSCGVVRESKTPSTTMQAGTLVSLDLLGSLTAILDKILLPLLRSRSDYGDLTSYIPEEDVAKVPEVSTFLTKVAQYRASIVSVVDSLQLTMALQKPSRRFCIDFNTKSFQKAGMKREVVECYEATVSAWIKRITKVLSQGMQDAPIVDASVTEHSNFGDDDGPDVELEFWKKRTTLLNHITDNLQLKANKTILGVLHAAGARAAQVTTEWADIELRVTEAANEAKDNAKYLSTLEKFAEPLFAEDPDIHHICVAIPAILNVIRMIHSISKFYNTSERLTGLFVKTTNQIIKCCRRYLERNGSVWDQVPEVAVRDLKACIELKETYLFHYRQTKGELAANPLGPQFDFPEGSIFGKFDLFSARLARLVDVMHVTRQFDKLMLANIEHIQPLCVSYREILKSLRETAGDYLEARRRDFDNRYQDYKYKVQELSTELVVFLNNCFLTVTNTAKALQLLSRFRAVLNNSHITSLLEEKHQSIFMSYGRDLESIKTVYERFKESPPTHRDTPPVAGAISWVRQLQRKVEEPMRVFQETPDLLHSRDARRIIKTYNKVAKTFVTYEARWYDAWATRLLDDAREGLQATLLVCDKASGRVYVNFDISIKQLCREVHCLMRLGLSIPPEARSVHSQKHALLNYCEELHFMLDRYYRLIDSISKIHSGLMIPHINRLNVVINPGLVQLTWTSLNIGVYLHDASRLLTQVETIVQRVNGILKHRIESSCSQIRKISFICLADDLTLPNVQPVPATNMEGLIALQRKHAKAVSHRLSVLNCEVATATREVVTISTAAYTSAEMASVQEPLIDIYNTFEQDVFQAILYAMQQSVLYLKTRITGPCSRGSTGLSVFLHPDPTMFHAELVVKMRTVDFSPSLEDLQKGVNKMARSILDSARGVYRWKQDGRAPHTYDIVEYQSAVLRTEEAMRQSEGEARYVNHPDSGSEEDAPEGSKSKLKSLFLRIGKNRKMTKVFLQLTGAVSSLQGQLQAFLQQFSCYDTLLRGNRANELESFNGQIHVFDDYEDQIRTYHSLEKEISMMPHTHGIGCLKIDLVRLKNFLSAEAAAWKTAYGISLNSRVKGELDLLLHNMEDIEAKLTRKVHDLSDVNGIMTVIAKMCADESEIDMRLQPIVSAYEVLYKYGVNVTKEEQDHVDRIGFQWNDLASQSRRIMDQLQEVGPRFKSVLLNDVASFQNQVRTFKQDYEKNGPKADNIEPRLALERLKVFEKQFIECKRKLQEYAMGEQLFGLPPTRYPEVEQIEKELKLLSKLYDLYTEVLAKKAIFEEMPWIEADVDKMRVTTKAYHDKVRRMPAAIRDWQGYKELREIVDELLDTIPILELLSARCVVGRHWVQLSAVTGANLNPRRAEFRLKHVLEAKLSNYRSEVDEISTSAVREHEIEIKLSRIKDEWVEREVTLDNFKQRGLLMLKPDTTADLISRVEEAQAVLTTLLSSRFNEPFKKEIMQWISKLTTTQERIGEWLEVQHLWVYMEAVFSGSGDIAKEMPAEVKRFSNIDRQWVKIMKAAAETPNALKLCVHSDMLSNLLPHLRLYLDMCQKSLSGYLTNKRKVQPRFFFVSNAQLLEILGQASSPSSVQQHLPSITNSMASLRFDAQMNVVGYASPEGEEVTLESPVSTDRDVVDWLQSLLESSVATLRELLTGLQGELLAFEGLNSSNATAYNSPTRGYVESCTAQLGILGLQILWTADCEVALCIQKSEKATVSNKVRKHKHIYESLVHMVRDPSLTKRQRITYESMVTVQIHQYETIIVLQKSFKKVRSTADFEWLKQTRFYCKTDRGRCVASITDVDFEYEFEHVGPSERLVVTDLTDRVYISAAQAVGMGYGACPMGPAGTGKTETIKGMGKCLGRYVIVMNCSALTSIHTMGNLFKGTAMSGCWSIFDEINRVDVKVLSVVAAQVACVLHGKRNRQAEVQFPDETAVRLLPTSTFFVTLNTAPGMEDGRLALPENMNALFRPISVVVLDKATIMRVKLAAAGFFEAALLARKFSSLYVLCDEQLTSHRHYDFGLRNIISVLRRCGALMQEQASSHPVRPNGGGGAAYAANGAPASAAAPGGSRSTAEVDAQAERSILITALREANLGRLVEDDGLLFSDLISDVFPGADARVFRKDRMHQVVAKEAHNHDFTQAPEWVAKIFQIYEQLNARPGVCVMGPSGCGKSSALQVLAQSMSTAQEVQVRVSRVNPKTVSVIEMYGKHDTQTGDWADGLFTALWRRAMRRADVISWVQMDGPIDPTWVESLNTVLDDTRLLTIPSNERLPLPPNLSLLFEVEDLNCASPATVSRLGIVHVGGRCLAWSALVDAWLLRHRQVIRSHAQTLLDIFAQNLPGLLSLAKTHCTPRMHLSDQLCVLNGLKLTEGLFADAGRATNPQVTLCRLTIFSMAWGVGGLMEPPCRERVSEFFRSGKTDVPDDNLFDYYVDTMTGQWLPWEAGVGQELLSPDTPLHRVFVPTEASVCLNYILHTATKPLASCPGGFRNALVLGMPGVGKTVHVQNFLDQSSAERPDFMSRYICLNDATSPRGLQSSIESYVEKISGSNWGPPPGNSLYIFIDDISLSRQDEWGSQPSLELVRQLLDDGFFYNRNRFENADKLVLASTNVISALSHAIGRPDIPSRLKQHFFIFNASIPSQTSLVTIFHTLLLQRFHSGAGFSPDVIAATESLAKCAVWVWEVIGENLAATPGREHVSVSLKDLSRLILGVTQGMPEAVRTPDNLVDLFESEIRRTFTDRLSESDAAWVTARYTEGIEGYFGPAAAGILRRGANHWIHFKHGDQVVDEDLVPSQPVYLPATQEEVLARLKSLLSSYNEANPRNTITLCMLNVQMSHLSRISRCLRTPRCSMILIGVPGSGRRTLVQLANFLCGFKLFELPTDPSYSFPAFLEDFREIQKHTAIASPATVLASELSLENEAILDVVNVVLSKGGVPGLQQKDELELLQDDLSPYLPKGKESSPEALQMCYANRVADNLHFIVLFPSTSSEGFKSKTRRFPALLKHCCIDIFHPWPEDAMTAAAEECLHDLPQLSQSKLKFPRKQIAQHAGRMHAYVQSMLERYHVTEQRQVVIPPGDFFEYLTFFKKKYTETLQQEDTAQALVRAGVHTLNVAQEDVSTMKRSLSDKQILLDRAVSQVESLLTDVGLHTQHADEQSAIVERTHNDLADQAQRVQKEKEEASSQLAAAEPALRVAEEALNTVKPDDVATLKRLTTPPPLIRRILDGVLLLRSMPVDFPVQWEVDTTGIRVIRPSWVQGRAVAIDPRFLQILQEFPKDTVNAEHCELLAPYLAMEDFTVDRAKVACGSLAGLCTWITMMTVYHKFAKSIAPKRSKLAATEAQLYKARQLLAKSEQQLGIKQAELKELRSRLQAAVDERTDLETDADVTRRRLATAETLLTSLHNEKQQWQARTLRSVDQMKTLPGNVATMAMFVCLSAPFNHRFRNILLSACVNDLSDQEIPYTHDVESLIFTERMKRKLELESLPQDEHSFQSAFIVHNALRHVLLIDPQEQGIRWLLKAHEAERGVVLTSIHSKDWLRTLCNGVRDGRTLIVEGVDSELPSALNALVRGVFTKASLLDGTSVNLVQIGDEEVVCSHDLKIFFVTSSAKAALAPDTYTKVKVVDFTLTLSGLTEQLLRTVVRYEKPSLEEDRIALLDEIIICETVLQECEDMMLQRLAQNQGSRLLEDSTLIEVLSSTKAKSNEIAERLKCCCETREKIDQAREVYHPVALRGALLYFTIIEMSRLCRLYHTSLEQFMMQFQLSMAQAPSNQYPPKRVQNVVAYLTSHVFNYCKRGYYTQDKHIFALLLAMGVDEEEGNVSHSEVECLAPAATLATHHMGGARDDNLNPTWLSVEAFNAILVLDREVEGLSVLKASLKANEGPWLEWHSAPTPETLPVPHIGERITPFQKLLLINTMRPDRFKKAAMIYALPVLGGDVSAVSPHDTDFSFVKTTPPAEPILCLLTRGSDTASPIESLARENRASLVQVSMGQGQEGIALRNLQQCLAEGGWIVFHNVHLNETFLERLAETLAGLKSPPPPGCRIWLTTHESETFPISILSLSTKVALEPPTGLKAGLVQALQHITQDQLESIHSREWRILLYAVSFFHCALVGRNRYGSIGWSTPYTFSHHDLIASMSFLYNHLYTDIKKGVSWATIQYMVCGVQYSGRVTDPFDAQILLAYGERWFLDDLFETHGGGFSFHAGYRAPDFQTIAEYRDFVKSLPDSEGAEVFGIQKLAEVSANHEYSRQMVESVMRVKATGPHACVPLNALEQVSAFPAGGLHHGHPSAHGGTAHRATSQEHHVLKSCRDIPHKLTRAFDAIPLHDMAAGQDAATPMGLLLHREVQAMQTLVEDVVTSCHNLERTILGQCTASAEAPAICEALLRRKVPDQWAARSWESKSLASWLNHGLQRLEVLLVWVTKGAPRAFWLSGLVFPKALFTVMKQEFVRPYLPNTTLDQVDVRTELTKCIAADVLPVGVDEGVNFVYGIFLQGAVWDKASHMITEPTSKDMYSLLPVVKVTCTLSATPESKHFCCPVFHGEKRGLANYIFSVSLKTDRPIDTWIMRGAAAMCLAT